MDVELKRVLGFWDLMGITMSQIIGAGILTYTGVAIGMTGRSVSVAYIIAAILTLITSSPIVIANGTLHFEGGQYSQVTELVSKRAGGFFIFIFIASNMSLSLYALSFGDYFISFFGFGDKRVVACTVLTVFYIINMLGIDKVSKIQRWIVFTLLASFSIFIYRGIGHVDPNYFNDKFLTGGLKGLLQAAALLNFAVVGGANIANLSRECKNPTRDLPRVIVICTVFVGFLYAAIAVVASGVLDVELVANKPMTDVARVILSKYEFIYFCVGGALIALISPLNGQFAWATKPIRQAAIEGWLPKHLAILNPNTRTPNRLLTILYLVGIVPIIFNLDMAELGASIVAVYQLNALLIIYSLIGLMNRRPLEFANSPYKFSRRGIYFLTSIAGILGLIQVGLLFMALNRNMMILTCLIVIGAILFGKYKKIDE